MGVKNLLKEKQFTPLKANSFLYESLDLILEGLQSLGMQKGIQKHCFSLINTAKYTDPYILIHTHIF